MSGYHVLGGERTLDERVRAADVKIRPWLGIVAVAGLAIQLLRLLVGR